jgi:T5SS/PEP-CTERM-associated repeat protein
MKRVATSFARTPSFGPALASAAAAVALASAPAHAQYYAYDGAVGTYPTNLFPIDTGSAVLDLGSANVLSVGSGGPGSFAALAGAVLSVGAVAVGEGGVGNGSVVASGAQVLVGGTLNRIQVGNWGTGSMTVSDGALVDAAVNADACRAPGAACFNYVGNAAGSNATLTVTGASSELRTLRGFTVGNLSVFTQDASGFDFGTPGGVTRATVKVQAGGTLRTEGANVGVGPGGDAPLGTERSFATVEVDGAGSRWIVTRNTIDSGTTAFLGIATHANATADVTVSGAGLLRIDGAGSAGPNDGVGIATGGKGTLTVTGAGSRLEVLGRNPFINVGVNAASSDGSLSVLEGGAASALYMNVGRNGGVGRMTVDGTGSLVTLSGVGDAASPFSAFASIGRQGGSGEVTVSGGGRWLITDGGMDNSSLQSSPGLAVGRDADSFGSLTISGAGSVVEIASTSLGPAPGTPDNYNPFVAIGYSNPDTASGTLTIEGGGKLILNGNAVSTPTAERVTQLSIGGRNGFAATGAATVTGAGSEIVLNGYDTLINVGRTAGSTGRLDVLDQARVSAINMTVGTGATGTVNVDHAQIVLSGARTDATGAGAGISVGRGTGGNGELRLTSGASLLITPTLLDGGLSIGGDAFYAGGTGAVALAGGSSIVIGGGRSGNRLFVGRTGNGTLDLAGGSSVDAGAGQVLIAEAPGSVGSLTLSGGSVLAADYVGVGSKPGGIDGGQGTLTVNASTVNAPTVEIGSFSLLAGSGGRINGTVVNRGTIGPGNSPGRLVINGGVLNLNASNIVLDVEDLGAGAYAVDELVLTEGSTFQFDAVNVTFNFVGSTDPTVAANAGILDLDNFLKVTNGSADSGLSSVFTGDQTWNTVMSQATFAASSSAYKVTDLKLVLDGTGQFTFNVTPVPEPAAWLLLLCGLLAIGRAAGRRPGAAPAAR